MPISTFLFPTERRRWARLVRRNSTVFRFDTSTADGSAQPEGVGGVRKPNKDLLEHDRKRQVQLRLLVLQDALADQGYTDAEIAEKIEEAKKAQEIKGRYSLELPGYNTMLPSPHMNEKCPSLPPNYDMPSYC
ncbi:hypothetical protein IEQ34_008637 [Dendrobium chrysotoxum]|uniref:CWF21 domain-containing protein n=1 Tax=Dendrobium chrysotoxum TaxID=161865 RepID=A0AAV7GYH0_DENCH|nr:hypothetical protein IEQ34_008637 [Dendrobium chrysotoxum]